MYISCIMCQGALLICMYIFLVCNKPSITVNHIKKSTLGTKVLQGQGSYYDGNIWYFGF